MPARSLFAVLFAVMIASPVLAQEQGGGNNRDRGGQNADRGGDRGGRGGFDPAAMRERYAGMIKEQMGATDEEWKVIEPKLTKVMDARRDSGGFGGGFRGRNRDDNNSANPQTDASPVQAASRELRQTLDNKDATAEQIAARLTALREAKEKSKTALVSAQKDLKEVLTQRQEAVLVMFGMLD
jgi:hypothetical protein